MPAAGIRSFLDHLDPGEYFDCGRARLEGIDEVLEEEAVRRGRPLGEDSFMLVATDVGLIYCRPSISFAIAGKWSDIGIVEPAADTSDSASCRLAVTWPIHGELSFVLSRRLGTNLHRRWAQVHSHNTAIASVDANARFDSARLAKSGQVVEPTETDGVERIDNIEQELSKQVASNETQVMTLAEAAATLRNLEMVNGLGVNKAADGPTMNGNDNGNDNGHHSSTAVNSTAVNSTNGDIGDDDMGGGTNGADSTRQGGIAVGSNGRHPSSESQDERAMIPTPLIASARLAPDADVVEQTPTPAPRPNLRPPVPQRSPRVENRRRDWSDDGLRHTGEVGGGTGLTLPEVEESVGSLSEDARLLDRPRGFGSTRRSSRRGSPRPRRSGASQVSYGYGRHAVEDERNNEGDDEQEWSSDYRSRPPSKPVDLGDLWIDNKGLFLAVGLLVLTLVLTIGAISSRRNTGTDQSPVGPVATESGQSDDSGATGVSSATEADPGSVSDNPTSTLATLPALTTASTDRPVARITTDVSPATAQLCHSNYSGCVPLDSDVDCVGQGKGPSFQTEPVVVLGVDVYRLDSDNDGTACEEDQPDTDDEGDD